MSQRYLFSLFGGGGGASVSRDSTNRVHKASGLVPGSVFIVYGNGSELGRINADIAGLATVTLASSPVAGTVLSYTQTLPGGTIPIQAGLPTDLPLVSGVGGPGNALMILAANGFDLNPQWVRGNHEDDSATYTEVVGTGTSYTFSAVGADNGKRVAYRGTNANGVTKTSRGTTCTTLKFGTYVGYGVGGTGNSIAPGFLKAFQDLVGGRRIDFLHDGSGADTWANFLSSSGGTVHAAWQADFPNTHMVWNLPLTMDEKSPGSGAQGDSGKWNFNDEIGDLVQGKSLAYVSSGQADTFYRGVARNLLAAGYGNGVSDCVTGRIGWEANGGWYSWAAINACRHVGDVAAGNVVAGNTIVLNGTTVTLTGTSPASVVADIKAGTATHGVIASIHTDSGRFILRPSVTANNFTIANGTGTPLAALGLTAGTYKANYKHWVDAFRRVVSLFREEAAAANKPDYFRFMWCPNKNELKCPPPLFFPGDDVVDEVSVDIYKDTWEPTYRYDRVGNFTYQMLGSVAYVNDQTAQYAGAWFASYSKAQGPSPMPGRSANGAAKRYSWCEGGTGFRTQGAGPQGSISGDDGHYITYSLKHLQAENSTGHNGYWNGYGADYHTRAILASIVLNSIRNRSHRTVSQWLNHLPFQTFTVEGQLPAGLWDEMPNQIRAFVRWWGTEEAQAALGTPAVVPQPTLTVANVSVAEGGLATFTFSLSAPYNDVVEVVTQTADGTAVGGTRVNGALPAGADYEIRPATRSYIQAGATSHSITIQTAADAVVEEPETFRLLISRPTTPNVAPNVYVPNYTLGTTEAVCTIYPGLSIAGTSVNEDAGTANFTVSIPHAVSYPFTVKATTRDGTAKAGEDYVAKTEALSFAAGETSKAFSVAIIDDTTLEGVETFFVDLSAPTPGAILVGTATCTIAASDGSAWQNWSGLVGDFDASQDGQFGFNGSSPAVQTWENLVTGAGDLTAPTVGNQPTRSVQTYAPYSGAAALNMPGVAFTSGNTAEQDYLAAAASELVSKAIDGTDPSATLILVGYLGSTSFAALGGWSINNGSATVVANDYKALTLSRSGSTTLGYRTSPSDAAGNILASPNLPAGQMFMLALAKSPTTVSIWTVLAGGAMSQITGAPGVSEVTADIAGAFSGQVFQLGSRRIQAAGTTLVLDTGMGGTLHHAVVSKARQSDAEIRAAMTALATKWKFGLT